MGSRGPVNQYDSVHCFHSLNHTIRYTVVFLPAPNACSEIPDNKILISYQHLVGSITYLAICTRPDILPMALGQFNAAPSRAHLACAKGVPQYLAGTVHLSLQFPSPVSSSLPSTRGLSDADWASDEKDRKSISGYCFYFLGSLVSWSSQKQQTVSTSSTESEYYTLTNTIKEAISLTLFLSLTKLPLPIPFPIFCDNQSTCTIANTDTISSQTKHIDVCHHFIHQHINDGIFNTIWIPMSNIGAGQSVRSCGKARNRVELASYGTEQAMI